VSIDEGTRVDDVLVFNGCVQNCLEIERLARDGMPKWVAQADLSGDA